MPFKVKERTRSKMPRHSSSSTNLGGQPPSFFLLLCTGGLEGRREREGGPTSNKLQQYFKVSICCLLSNSLVDFAACSSLILVPPPPPAQLSGKLNFGDFGEFALRAPLLCELPLRRRHRHPWTVHWQSPLSGLFCLSVYFLNACCRHTLFLRHNLRFYGDPPLVPFFLPSFLIFFPINFYCPSSAVNVSSSVNVKGERKTEQNWKHFLWSKIPRMILCKEDSEKGSDADIEPRWCISPF